MVLDPDILARMKQRIADAGSMQDVLDAGAQALAEQDAKTLAESLLHGDGISLPCGLLG